MVDEHIDYENETAFVSAINSGMQSGSMDGLQAVPLTYKTKKTTGGKMSDCTGRTLLARFAIKRGIQHPKLDAYLAGSSGFGGNDDTVLCDIAFKLLQSYAWKTDNLDQLLENMAVDLHAYGNPPTEAPAQAATVIATPKLEFAVAPTVAVEAPTAPALPTVPAAPVPVEAPVATATPANDKVLLTSWNQFTQWVQSMTPAQLQAMKAQLDAEVHAFYYTNERSSGGVARYGGWNGAGSATEWIDASKLTASKNWDEAQQNASFHIVADVLQIRPKRQINGKGRSWFWQLLDCSDATTNGTRIYLCELLAGYIVNMSKRTHYNARLAVHVTDAFRQEMITAFALKTSVRDSAVVGGTAKSWNWKYEAGGFTPNRRTEVADITADTFSLSNL